MTMKRLLRHFLYAALYAGLGAVLVLVGLYVYLLEQRPDLKPWHRVELHSEFRAEDAARVPDLHAYLRLEERLFRELDERVVDAEPPVKAGRINRYTKASLVDPASREINWNRSFELPSENPTAVVLMLHGLSDSPYSMRALARALNRHGAWIVGLRLPGHGTAPSGLLDARWQDASQAVRLAARHLHRQVPGDHPLYLVGYSNGAALAVEYALAVLEGQQLPKVSGLVLLSPAVGVTPVAALAIWQERLSWIAGLEKLAWNSIQPEFDPYKYNSFTVNAANQIYQLTGDIARRRQQLAKTGTLRDFPPVLAFQSVVDATIAPATLVDNLFRHLSPGGHQLVLFDVNRHAESEVLMKSDPAAYVSGLLERGSPGFDLTLVTNGESDGRVVARTRPAGGTATQEQALPWHWPSGVFSLSHVALPFPPDDPVYGSSEEDDKWLTLGSVTIRGERDLLQIPDNYFIRLRHNPFFGYLLERTRVFMSLP